MLSSFFAVKQLLHLSETSGAGSGVGPRLRANVTASSHPASTCDSDAAGLASATSGVVGGRQKPSPEPRI